MRQRPYHHGDLRRALVDAATTAIAESGPAALSLRDVARRVGVSHAAPAHHFGSKTGLLTAVAARGFDGLADALAAARADGGALLEVGVAYVRFAVAHPGEFAVMFQPGLLDWADPELGEAGNRARQELREAVASAAGEAADPEAAELAAWSLAHGLASLIGSGTVSAGDDVGALARRVGAAVPRPGIQTGDIGPAR